MPGTVSVHYRLELLEQSLAGRFVVGLAGLVENLVDARFLVEPELTVPAAGWNG